MIFLKSARTNGVESEVRRVKKCNLCSDEIEPGYAGYNEGLCEICYDEDFFEEREE
ncbi:hypothetical protein vBBceSLY4_000017 [Bacillus phage vB_BceS_LY4]|nr:hypothetical protein vBBceSLY4_000017 [Bacillus phage vB_BceS_LY4]